LIFFLTKAKIYHKNGSFIWSSSTFDKMFEIFGPIFKQNANINFEPIFKKSVNFGPICERSVNFCRIFGKKASFSHTFKKV